MILVVFEEKVMLISDALSFPVYYGFKAKLFYIEIATQINAVETSYEDGIKLRELYEDLLQQEVCERARFMTTDVT